MTPATSGGAARALARLDAALAAVEQAVASLALAAALLISLYAVLMRALRVPTGEWVLELPIELLLVIAVYGSGALLARRAHMRVVFFVERLAPRAGAAAAACTQALLALVCAFLTSRAAIAAGQASGAGMYRRELFGAPEALFVWVGAAGIALWTLHAVIGLVQALAAGGPIDIPTPGAPAD